MWTRVPEIIQATETDCGPACLTAVFQGFGVAASYGRLRELCQTSVDGSSIDALEAVANELGLDAEQIVIPADHVLDPAAATLPCIAVTAQPNAVLHFVVIWRRLGPFFEVMDPGVGRRLVRAATLERALYVHTLDAPPEAYVAYAAGAEAGTIRRSRAENLGVAEESIERALGAARDDALAYGRVDAALRCVAWLVRSRSLTRGDRATRLFDALVATDPVEPAIPGAARTVGRALTTDGNVTVSGAVILRFKGRRQLPSSPAAGSTGAEGISPIAAEVGPLRRVARHFDRKSLVGAIFAAIAVMIIGASVLLEPLLFRFLLALGDELARRGRAVAIALVAAAGLGVGAFEFAAASLQRWMGRRLETRVRVALLGRLPAIEPAYFESRLVSDMAERIHSIAWVRDLPEIAVATLVSASSLAFVVGGLVWLAPDAVWLIVLGVTVAVAAPLASLRYLDEAELRTRGHAAGLGRFYLDALRGLAPVVSHGAEDMLRREHEVRLVAWEHSARAVFRASTWSDAAVMTLGALFAAGLVAHVGLTGERASLLLLVFWAFEVALLGHELVHAVQRLPTLRSVLVRLAELLDAPVTATAPSDRDDAAWEGLGDESRRGVAIHMEAVSTVAGGHRILDEVALSITPGEHLAIVGPSGSGKSSLVALMLGLVKPASGRLEVDGTPLDDRAAQRLREVAAWVDPDVALWDQTLYDNLRYGSVEPASTLGRALDASGLVDILGQLPQGLQSPLGSGGGVVSGGQGQRVRLGRALHRGRTRLAVLDEAFRGLDRETRASLLTRARHHFAEATLVCVTHDLAETRAFPRVIVMESGRVVEDGPPESLFAQPASRYRDLLTREVALRETLFGVAAWKRLVVDGGKASWEVPS